jgi:hypothetical protein
VQLWILLVMMEKALNLLLNSPKHKILESINVCFVIKVS